MSGSSQSESIDIVRLEQRVDGIYAFALTSSEVKEDNSEFAVGKIKYLIQLECDIAEGKTNLELVQSARYEVCLDNVITEGASTAKVAEESSPSLANKSYMVSPRLLLALSKGVASMCSFECWNYLETSGTWSIIVSSGFLCSSHFLTACQNDEESNQWWVRVKRFDMQRLVRSVRNRADAKWSLTMSLLSEFIVACASGLKGTVKSPTSKTSGFKTEKYAEPQLALSTTEDSVAIPIHIGRRSELTKNKVITGAVRCSSGSSVQDYWILYDVTAMRDSSLLRVAFDSEDVEDSVKFQSMLVDYRIWHQKECGTKVDIQLSKSHATFLIRQATVPAQDSFSSVIRRSSRRSTISVSAHSTPTKGESLASPRHTSDIVERASNRIELRLWGLKYALKALRRALTKDAASKMVLVLSKEGVWHDGTVQKRLSEDLFEVNINGSARLRKIRLSRLKSFNQHEALTQASPLEMIRAGLIGEDHSAVNFGSPDSSRSDIMGGQAGETYDDFIEACDVLVTDSKRILRPGVVGASIANGHCWVRFWCGLNLVQSMNISDFQVEHIDKCIDDLCGIQDSPHTPIPESSTAKVMHHAISPSSAKLSLRVLAKFTYQFGSLKTLLNTFNCWKASSLFWLLRSQPACFEAESPSLVGHKMTSASAASLGDSLFCFRRMNMTSKVQIKQRYWFRSATHALYYCSAVSVPKFLQELVNNFERWHLINVGYDSSAWLSRRAASICRDDASSGEDSYNEMGEAGADDSEDHEELDRPSPLKPQGSSEPHKSPFDSVADPEECIKKAWSILRSEGEASLNRYQHPLRWEIEVLLSVVAQGKLTSRVPLISSNVSDLIGHPLVVYATKLSSQELKNMANADRKFAFFAIDTRVVGEGIAGSLELSVQVEVTCSIPGALGVTFAVPLSACYKSVKSLEAVLSRDDDLTMAALCIQDRGMARACHGKNFKMETEEQWKLSSSKDNLGLKDDAMLNEGDASFKDFLSSFNTMVDKNGTPRDLLSEALLRENPSFQQGGSSFAAGGEDETDYPDLRTALTEAQKAQGKERCPIVGCDGIIKKHAVDCPKCGCWPKNACQCKNCRTKFDPNERNSCAFCSTVFPHAGARYEQQQMMAALSAAVKGGSSAGELGGEASTSGKGKDKKSIQTKENDAVVTRILSDDRGAPEVRVRHVRTAAAFLHSLSKIVSNSAEDTLHQKSPLPGLTCGVDFDMLSSISTGSFGKPGKGLSVWQCLPSDDEAWDSKRYFKQGRDKEKRFSAEQYAKMRYEIQMPVAIRGVQNLVIIMQSWSNSGWSRAVQRNAEIFASYFTTLEAKIRSSTFTAALFLDFIDVINELCSDYLRELVSMDKTNDLQTSCILLKERFPDLDIRADSLDMVPYIEVRNFCEKHNGTLSASSWPEEEFDCNCRWHRTIRRRLKEFQASPVSLAKAKPKVGSAVGGNAGGVADQFKTSMNNKYQYPVYNGGRSKDAKKYNREEKAAALKDFFELIAIAVPNEMLKGKKLCIGSLGYGTDKARGCQERSACTYYHKADALGHITEDHLNDYPRVKAFLIAKCNGTKWKQNVLTGGRKQKISELADMVNELLAEADDTESDGGSSYTHVSAQGGTPSAEITVLGIPASGDKAVDKTRDPAITIIDSVTKKKVRLSGDLQKAACKCGSFGGVPCDPSSGMFDWQKCGFKCVRAFSSAIEHCTPCSGLADASSLIITADNAVEIGANVAELSRVCFAQNSKRGDPSLLGTDASCTWKPHACSITMLGEVAVESSELLVISCKAVAHAKSVDITFEVCECGEDFEGQNRQCETLTTAAACRTRGGTKTIKEGRAADALKWKRTRTGTMANAAWISEYIANGDGGASRAVRRLEANVVASSLTDSQPILPHQSAVLMQPSAANIVEVKIFIDKFDQVSMQTGIPLNVVDSDHPTGLADVPVVYKVYYRNHARPAVLRSLVIDGIRTDFSENTAVINSSWEGMCAHQWRSTQRLFQHSFSVANYAALSVEQTLSGETLPFPDFVTQLNCSEQFGGNANKDCFEREQTEASFENAYDWQRELLMEPVGLKGCNESTPMNYFFSDSSGARADCDCECHGRTACTSQCGLCEKKSCENEVCKADCVNCAGVECETEYDSDEGPAPDLVSEDESEDEDFWDADLSQPEVGASHSDTIQATQLEVEWHDFNMMFGAAQEGDAMPADFDWRTVEQTELINPSEVESEPAKVMMTRAARALVLHMEKARTGRQGAKAPDEEWMDIYGQLMTEVVRWSWAALPTASDVDKAGCIESLLRRLENPFQPTAHMNATVVDDFFADLPEDLKDSLKETMSTGVDVGLPPMPDGISNSCKASHTASQNSVPVKKELRKFTANTWVRAYPPNLRRILARWGIRVSSCHFVIETDTVKARLIADLSRGSPEAPDDTVNELSPDQGWDGVQCDYIDQMIEVLAQFIEQESGLKEFELIAIKADLKSAFLQIPLSLHSIGSISIEFEGWLYVFGRTPFGWKWATHTWSEFSRAIKLKVNNFERHKWSSEADNFQVTAEEKKFKLCRANFQRMGTRLGILQNLPMAKKTEALALWKSYLAFFYVDDNYSLTQKLKHKPHILADVLRLAGFLLLGYSCWSFEKAKDDGFFATVHAYTGIFIDISDPTRITVSFSQHRCEKIIGLLQEATEDQGEYKLGWVQSTWGNLVWFFKVYVVLRAFAAPLRRMLQGVPTATAKADDIVKPQISKLGETQASANKKCYRDLLTTKFCVEHLLECKKQHGDMHHSTSVPIECMRDADMRSVTNWTVKASFGGDASKVAWSCLNHVTREYMLIPMPKILQEAIQRALSLDPSDPRRIFFIGVAEHMVLLFGLIQWGSEWHMEEIYEVLYHTDSQNSFQWARSGFAGNELAQDFARLAQAMQMVLNLRITSVWWATTIIWMADTLSRMLTEEGKVIESVKVEFETENVKLTTPYREVEPKAGVWWLVDRIKESRNAFHSMSPVHLAAEQLLFKQLVAGAATNERAELHRLRNEFTTDDMKAFFRSATPAWSFAHVGSAACVDAHGVAKTKRLLPKWGSEIDPPRKAMWQDATATRCIGDFFNTEAAALSWVMLLIITLPCENYSSSGNWRGSKGDTGWMWLAMFEWVVIMQPLVFFSEQADNAINVNNGSDLAKILSTVKHLYIVYIFVIKVADYGSCTHRKRLLLIGIRKDCPGALDFRAPKATHGTWKRITLSDVLESDSLTPESEWFTQPLQTMYPYKVPSFGEMQFIGRLAPHMGHSSNPHVCLGRLGVAQGPTGYGGGGTLVDEDYMPGDSVWRRRKISLREYHGLATAPDSMLPWHQQFSSDPAYLLQCINQGFPTLVMHAWMTQICDLLEANGVEKDMPHGVSSWAPSSKSAPAYSYVTTNHWDAVSGRKEEASTVGGRPFTTTARPSIEVSMQSQHTVRPTTEDCDAWLKGLQHDWSKPLYPLTGGRRPDLSHLKTLTHAEWSQMHYIRLQCQQWGLEKNSTVAYELGQRHFAQFCDRYPISTTFSAAHTPCYGLFAPPWTPTETEAILMDFVLHEVGVRGNGWSSCRTKLYGVRHKNVFNGYGDVLKGKPRLWQLLAAVKKIKGPSAPKHMVTVAMLHVIQSLLDLNTDHGILTWAAVLTAFHFMMRSSEYLAKLQGGAFDLDRVIRVMDIAFFKNGRITEDYTKADEVRVTFGKSKTTGGGEVRAQIICDSSLCVVRVLASLFSRMAFQDRTRPLFAWLPHMAAKSKGHGLRYCDMMSLLKRSALLCGHKAADFGTHSLRRGGGGAYLAAGATLEQVTFHGRWAPGSQAAVGYVAPGAVALLCGFQGAVLRGQQDARVLLQQAPRPRQVRDFQMAQAFKKHLAK